MNKTGHDPSDTLLTPGGNCWRVEKADRFAVLMENAAYFEALRSALAKARRSVVILGWQFDPRTRLDPQTAHDDHHAQIGVQIIGPGIAVALVGQGPLAGRPEPALARKIPQGPRGGAVHDRHHLMPGRRDQSRRLAAAGIIVQMLLRIPSVRRDVAAAAEGDLVVDDDDLLVMACAERGRRVEPELDHPFAKPALGLVRIETL